MRAVMQKDATDDAIEKAAEAVENYLTENPDAQKEIGRISGKILDAGKLENSGTPRSQELIRGWAEKYGKQK